MAKYKVLRDAGWPIKPADPFAAIPKGAKFYDFGEIFDPDPTGKKGDFAPGSITAEMCAKGVESGYIALVDPAAGGGKQGSQTSGSGTQTSGASVPVLITAKMRADLEVAGFKPAEIDAMTPQEAHEVLSKK